MLASVGLTTPMTPGLYEVRGGDVCLWHLLGYMDVIFRNYLVDPASSHMLVSKIKPCMSKYKLFYTVKLRMAH